MSDPDLYAVPPEEFTAARTAAVKAARVAGDRDAAAHLVALRRPSASAWVVNQLVRQSPDLIDQLLDLGHALAAAQASGAGDALRELGAQRRDLVAAVAQQAVADSGRPATAAVRLEVEQTLEAALADPASGEAVRSGRLVRALSYAGFGAVELDGAVAEPAPEPRAAVRKKPTAAQVRAAERAALEAAGALDDAVRRCEQAQRERAAARTAAEQAATEVERLRVALDAAQGAETDAERQVADRDDAALEAADAVARAQAAAEEARVQLDRLRRD